VVAALAGVALGAVFLVAGASKVAAGARWPQQAVELGAPRAVAPVVPWWEIVLGALLVAGVARRAVATLAVLTLAVFTALIVVQLRRGRRPPCACFGSWSARPLGWGHVVRNALFAATGVLAAALG
jgi:hypothetical protein